MGQSLSLRHGSFRPFISWPSLRSGTLALIVCVCAALIGTEAWQLWRVYEANIDQTEIVTANTARSMA